MRILVTGATGFIGRHVINELVERRNAEVIAASRHPDERTDVRWVKTDLLQAGAPSRLIDDAKPTHLIHLAWNAKPGQFWNAADNLDWCASSLTLLRAFTGAGGRRAVISGTCAEYAWVDEPLNETHSPIDPSTPYGIAKDALRRIAFASAPALQLSLAWGRIFWLYGPNEPQGRLVSDVAESICRGQPAPVSEGLQERDFLHVADVAGALSAALYSDYEGPFNIASGKPVAVHAVIQSLANALRGDELLRFGARGASTGELARIYADTAILNNLIGFKPHFDLESGILQTADWWRSRSDFIL